MFFSKEILVKDEHGNVHKQIYYEEIREDDEVETVENYTGKSVAYPPSTPVYLKSFIRSWWYDENAVSVRYRRCM